MKREDKKRTRKLRLNKETVRILTPVDLQSVQAGKQVSDESWCCQSGQCNTVKC